MPVTSEELVEDRVPARVPLTASEQQLRTAQDMFIRRWGEMGATWGINRTMAEIHALLYIMGTPCCTDDVMERLNISRGNASMSLRGLCDWGIIRRMHKRGERREFFESLTDVWEIFSIIAAERKTPGDGPCPGSHSPVPTDAQRAIPWQSSSQTNARATDPPAIGAHGRIHGSDK